MIEQADLYAIGLGCVSNIILSFLASLQIIAGLVEWYFSRPEKRLNIRFNTLTFIVLCKIFYIEYNYYFEYEKMGEYFNNISKYKGLARIFSCLTINIILLCASIMLAYLSNYKIEFLMYTITIIYISINILSPIHYMNIIKKNIN